MKSLKIICGVMILAILLVLNFFENVEAMPAFARKYETSCMTCHATFPRLTALGEAVRLNGYKMPDGDELYVKDKPVSMGAEAWEKVFPDAVWPSHIPGSPPIAIRVINDLNIDTGGTKDSTTEFDLPQEIKFLSAGSLGKSVSFFVEIEFEESELHLDVEKHDGMVEEVKIEAFESGTEFSAWLMFEDLFVDNLMNLKVGAIGMQEFALPNARTHNSITVQPYLYAEELGMHHGKPGIELNGFNRFLRYNLGVSDGGSGSSKKDYYGVLSFKFGGLGYDGSGGTTEEGSEEDPLKIKPSGYWLDNSFLIGMFFQRSYVGDDNDIFNKFGIDLKTNYNDLSVSTGYMIGDNVILGGHGGGHGDEDMEMEINKDIFHAEAEYFLYPWLQPYIRYENVNSKGNNEDKARFIAGTAILVRANVKLNVEGRIYTKHDSLEAAGGTSSDDNQIALRLDYAF